MGQELPAAGGARPARKARTGQICNAPDDSHRCVGLEGNRRQALPDPGERYPAPIHDQVAPVGALQGRQHLEAGMALIAAVIEQELVIGIEASGHIDALKSGHRVDAAGPERHDLAGARREPVPLGLSPLPPMPLP